METSSIQQEKWLAKAGVQTWGELMAVIRLHSVPDSILLRNNDANWPQDGNSNSYASHRSCGKAGV